jgi:hypothetical protein
MRLHKNNATPATPIKEIEKWGTEKQVSAFIEDIWPVNWTRKAFDYYIAKDKKGLSPFDVETRRAREEMEGVISLYHERFVEWRIADDV